MSHFVVWIDTEDISLIDKIMEPFSKNTEYPDYLEFQNVDEEERQIYETLKADCVRMANGSNVILYDSFYKSYTIKNGVVYQKNSGRLHHEKRTKKAKKMTFLPNYPIKKIIKTYKDYMELCCGYMYDEDKGAYGYYINPKSFYTGYDIGGCWPYMFLVRSDCAFAIDGEKMSWFNGVTEHPYAPEGYKWTAGARKKDIAWDIMKQLGIQEQTKSFFALENGFRTGRIPQEYPYAQITKEGILIWQLYLYKKGETLEQYLERHNFGPDSKYPYNFGPHSKYPCLPAGFVHGKEYFLYDNMDLFGMSINKNAEKVWREMVQQYLEKIPHDSWLVSLDCYE